MQAPLMDHRGVSCIKCDHRQNSTLTFLLNPNTCICKSWNGCIKLGRETCRNYCQFQILQHSNSENSRSPIQKYSKFWIQHLPGQSFIIVLLEWFSVYFVRPFSLSRLPESRQSNKPQGTQNMFVQATNRRLTDNRGVSRQPFSRAWINCSN